jgi:hypothetical protein
MSRRDETTRTFKYLAEFKPDDKGAVFAVSFPDIPEAASAASVARMSEATSGILRIYDDPAYRMRSCGLLACVRPLAPALNQVQFSIPV